MKLYGFLVTLDTCLEAIQPSPRAKGISLQICRPEIGYLSVVYEIEDDSDNYICTY